MKRLIDIFLSLLAAIVLAPIIVLVAIAIAFSMGLPILYWSDRIGKNNRIFSMPKFRSMLKDTPALATHLLNNPNTFIPDPVTPPYTYINSIPSESLLEYKIPTGGYKKIHKQKKTKKIKKSVVYKIIN